MATNYKLGLLTAAVLTACNAEDILGNRASSSDKTPPAVELKVHLIDGPTYHPTLSVKVDDLKNLPEEEFSSNSDYVLSSDGSIKPPERKGAVTISFIPSSNLHQTTLLENGEAIITRTNTFENEMYASDYFSVDLGHDNGEYIYQAKAEDNAGNSAESSLLTLVFKNGYAYPKESVMKDKTKPTVILHSDLLVSNNLCASISELKPDDTGILEATLLDGAKVISHYVADQRAGYNKTLDTYLYGSGDNHFCLTNLPHKRNSLNFNIPTPETVAAVKDVVVVAKDFAGNETRITYSQTEDFKFMSEIVKRYEEIDNKYNRRQDLPIK